MTKTTTVRLNVSEYHAIRRALAIASQFYINPKGLPDVTQWKPAERAAAAGDVDMAASKFPEVMPTARGTIKVKVEQRPHTPEGKPDGRTSWQVWVLDPGGHPFSGCPLGRSTGGERPAIRDLIRPGYSLPGDTDVTLDDVEVVERRVLVEGKGWVTLDTV